MKTYHFPVLLLLLLSLALIPGAVSDEGGAILVSGDHANVIYRISYGR